MSLAERRPSVIGRASRWSDDLPTEWLRGSATLKAGGVLGRRDGEGVVRFVRSGWLGRARQFDDGRRQIIELLLPGDHLPACAAHGSDSLAALSPCEIVGVPSSVVQNARLRCPELDARLDAAEGRQAAIMNERIVCLGQRTATERAAHLVCELLHRLGHDGPAEACEWPLLQVDVADYLGLSVVHTNRTLQALRRMSLVQTGRGWLRAPDMQALAKLAGFTPDYLG